MRGGAFYFFPAAAARPRPQGDRHHGALWRAH